MSPQSAVLSASLSALHRSAGVRPHVKVNQFSRDGTSSSWLAAGQDLNSDL